MSDFRLDFLCVGFNKCGTSSLSSVMKQIPEIRLPYEKKETLFFSWYQNYPDPVEMLQKRYFPDESQDSASGGGRRILGAIEPSFMKHAEGVFRYFGEDVKLVFMLRNPADAIWSLYKMRLRRIKGGGYTELYRAEHGDIDRMFRHYLRRFVKMEKDSDFFYDYWLRSFLEYYPREQMHFILFENYIRNYQQEMEELGSFLGFSTDQLPAPRKQNVGDRVSRNYFCAEINRRLTKISMEARTRETNREVFLNEKLLPAILDLTLMDCPVELSGRNRQEALDVFYNSVRRTEELIGLPLEKLWYV